MPGKERRVSHSALSFLFNEAEVFAETKAEKPSGTSATSQKQKINRQ